MSVNVDIFRNRLAQLKRTLESGKNLPEQLFYSAFQIEKDKDLQKTVVNLLEKHKFQIKKGYIQFTGADEERVEHVRTFLKEAFSLMLSAFKIDKTDLIKKKEPEKTPSAVGLFEMASKLQSSDEDYISDEQAALTEIDQASSNIEAGELVPEQGTIPDDSVPNHIEPIPVEVQKPATISPPKHPRPVKSPEPELKPIEIQKSAFVPPPKPPRPVIASGVAAAASIKPVMKPVTKPVGIPPQKPKPALEVPHGRPTVIEEVDASPAVIYEYYMCNRCGELTSKGKIRHVGDFLECPRCHFQFSLAEAQIIMKKSQDLVAPPKPKVESILEGVTPRESLVRPSELFGANETTSPEESLIRPSQLLKGYHGEDEGEGVSQQQEHLPAEKPEQQRQKPIGDHLVRPSQVIGPGSSQSDGFYTMDQGEELHPPDIEQNQEGQVINEFKTGEGGIQEQCPKCGSTKFNKIQDRSKILSYSPLVYGYKKKCLLCSFEFD